MRDRFTHKSRVGRGKIPRQMRLEIFKRDDFTCQYCGSILPAEELTIDHLVPIADGGLDEQINYISACLDCNQRKDSMPLDEFAKLINVPISALKVHGDPIIDNENLPIQFRLLRKRTIDKLRRGSLPASGKTAQKKIEKDYRRALWASPEGKSLGSAFPSLPGHVRVMIPEIRLIAKTTREFLLLLELAKSANTRNLIGTVLSVDCDVESRLIAVRTKSKDLRLTKRIDQAMCRLEKALIRFERQLGNSE